MRLFGREPVQLRESFRDNIELPLRSTLQPNGAAAQGGADANGDLSADNKNPALDPKFKIAQNRRKYIIGALLVLAFFLFSGVKYKKPSVSSLSVFFKSTLPVQDANLWLLLPHSGEGDRYDVNTCRLVLGAAALGYPTPWVVDYESGRSEAERIGAFLDRKDVGEDDIVIIAEDAWVQLRSEVLLQRFFDITKDLNKQISKKGSSAWVKILAAESDSRLDQHLLMGPAKHLRSVFDYAAENKLSLDAVYGSQLAASHRRLSRRQDDEKQPQISPADLGIGLDSEHLLLANLLDLHGATANRKMDLAYSEPPFWTVAGFVKPDPPNGTWTDISLLSTDDSKHTVPALVRYDSKAGKDDLESSWSSLWYHSHARTLLSFAVHLPHNPLAVIVDTSNKQKIERRFWNPLIPYQGSVQLGVKSTGDPDLHAWSEICGGDSEAKEIFGDDKGKWQDTEG